MLIFERKLNHGDIILKDNDVILMTDIDLWTAKKLQQLLNILGREWKEEDAETIQKVFN